ncbi:MAG: hypothetical protein WED00_06920 [Aquisalimonadaceae bacterium]
MDAGSINTDSARIRTGAKGTRGGISASTAEAAPRRLARRVVSAGSDRQGRFHGLLAVCGCDCVLRNPPDDVDRGTWFLAVKLFLERGQRGAQMCYPAFQLMTVDFPDCLHDEPFPV